MRIAIFICLLLGVCKEISAGWNENFDRQRHFLIKELSQFHTQEYIDEYRQLVRARRDLLKNEPIIKEIAGSSQGDKYILIDPVEGFVLKKRVNNNIREHFIWELSHLIGVSDFIVPSLAVEIGKKQVVLQKKEFFISGKGIDKKPHAIFLKKIGLRNYWKAHIGAYLLGLSDLSGVNIGVSIHGDIRFFDNESSLKYSNEATLSNPYFKAGFICKSLDWPQYREPLDKNAAESLNKFVRSLDNLEEDMRVYLDGRSIEIDEEGFFYRLEKVRSFVFKENVSFRDFYGFLFPRMSPGLDELCEIIGEITDRSVGHGSALLFASREGKKYQLSRSQKKAMRDWLNTYICSP